MDDLCTLPPFYSMKKLMIHFKMFEMDNEHTNDDTILNFIVDHIMILNIIKKNKREKLPK